MATSENILPSHETPSSISTHFIPEWFLTEILCRLPSKHVIRCKCISKQFLSLISDPAFICNYISRASKHRPWTLITMLTQGDWPQEETFNFERNLELSSLVNSHESPTLSILVTPEKLVLVVAMSNGFFLCRWNLAPYHAIFNPVTKQSIVLPESDWLQQECGTMAFHAHVDHVVGMFSYKVARLRRIWGVPTTDHIIEELSSETNNWTSFTAHFPEPILSSKFLNSFNFKGIFHWYDEVSDNGSGCIISYDPVRIIRCTGSGRIIWCGEIVGPGGEHTIRCIKHDNRGFIHLWRMKDYEQGTWHLDHTFSINEILLPSADHNEMVPCRKLTNITFHPSEPDLLYFWGQAEEIEWMLVSFDVQSRRSRVSNTIPRARSILEVQQMFFLHTPFLLPSWPAILPDPSQQNNII